MVRVRTFPVRTGREILGGQPVLDGRLGGLGEEALPLEIEDLHLRRQRRARRLPGRLRHGSRGAVHVLVAHHRG